MSKTTVDTSETDAFFRKAPFTTLEMLAMEKVGALTVLNSQKNTVQVVTGNLQGSINIQVQNSSPLEVESHIGPNTPYAAAVEFGRPDMPNYPIQPYVRPSAAGASAKLVRKVIATALEKTLKRKHG